MQKSLKLAVLCLSLTVAGPALALDCSKAKSVQSKAICANPQAGAADAAMSKAYVTLARRLSPANRKALELSQRLWLRDRDNGCGADLGTRLASCLAQMSLARERFLEGLPQAGPGSGGRLQPVFIQQAGRRGYYEIDVTALKYAPPTTPAERLFNFQIDKLLKDVPAGKNDEFGADMIYNYMVHVRMTYASPQLISAQIETYQFTGGAHGNGGISNINIDAQKSKLLQFVDVFPAAARAKLDAACLRQILKAKAERLQGEKITADDLKQIKAGIDDGIGKLASWSFSPQGASVAYDAYALGAYAEGAYSCEFPPAFLRPLVKGGFALP